MQHAARAGEEGLGFYGFPVLGLGDGDGDAAAARPMIKVGIDSVPASAARRLRAAHGVEGLPHPYAPDQHVAALLAAFVRRAFHGVLDGPAKGRADPVDISRSSSSGGGGGGGASVPSPSPSEAEAEATQRSGREWEAPIRCSLYTMTPDRYFVLDYLPKARRHHDELEAERDRSVVVFAGGCGRAFKFAPLLGQALAALAIDGLRMEEEEEQQQQQQQRSVAGARRHRPPSAEALGLPAEMDLAPLCATRPGLLSFVPPTASDRADDDNDKTNGSESHRRSRL
eukprot:scaffold580_cov293-Prasinococcus_capsulatus_cf.AAC.5